MDHKNKIMLEANNTSFVYLFEWESMHVKSGRFFIGANNDLIIRTQLNSN